MSDSGASVSPVTVVEVLLHLPEEGLSVTVLVEQLGPTQFKLWSYPFFARTVAVRDIIEAEVLEEPDANTGRDRIELKRVVSRAGWSTYDVLCPSLLTGQTEFRSCLSHVQESGGFTENLGDLYVFYWPPEVHIELQRFLQPLQLARDA
jgi:hypothetical protein